MLLAKLEELVPGGSSLIVSTAEANVPAVSLYGNCGYTLTSVSRSLEGITLAHFKKIKAHN